MDPKNPTSRNQRQTGLTEVPTQHSPTPISDPVAPTPRPGSPGGDQAAGYPPSARGSPASRHPLPRTSADMRANIAPGGQPVVPVRHLN